jgi:hypothetical protein
LKRTVLVLIGGLALAGCAEGGARPALAPAPAPYVAVTPTTAGLARVIGQPSQSLITLFGQPAADVREGTARKLQFQSDICVLDAYLYPQGKSEPIVTYVDAREPDGSPIDKTSCVSALQLHHSRH